MATAFDLKISRGLIYNGDGSAPYQADIAIHGGLIVQIGGNLGPAAREIEADGLIVTPGFIDPHTHYDAQALWDGDLETSIRHGVTTAIGGNCGVGFAPLKPHDKADVISLMAGVEDIPAQVLEQGLHWDWESFGEYLDRMEAVARPIDVGFNVPHDCVRLHVMGQRAAAGEAATAADITAMAQVLKESLLAGGVGFSFGRVFGHRTDDGRQTPSYYADAEELTALCAVLSDLPYRVLQGVTDGRVADGAAAFDAEYAIVKRMVKAAGRPVSLNLHRRSQPEFSQGAWRQVMAVADDADGMIRFQVNAKGVGTLYGLTSSVNLLAPFPSYRAIADRSLAERVAILSDPKTRARLLAETPINPPSDPRKMSSVMRALSGLEAASHRVFRMAKTPNYEPQAADSLAGVASARGIDVLSAYYDLSLEDEGRMLLEHPMMNYVEGNLDNLREMLTHPCSFFGVGDAGAHLGYVCDVGYATMALQFWSKDRTLGDTIPLPAVVNMLTGKVADHFGFKDRGRIKVGLRADLNIIDYDALTLLRPRQVADLPAGGQRFLQDALGYRAVLVAGTAVLEYDAPTGAKPGRVLRGAA